MAQQQWVIENANLYTNLMNYTKHATHHNGKCRALKKKKKNRRASYFSLSESERESRSGVSAIKYWFLVITPYLNCPFLCLLPEPQVTPMSSTQLEATSQIGVWKCLLNGQVMEVPVPSLQGRTSWGHVGHPLKPLLGPGCGRNEEEPHTHTGCGCCRKRQLGLSP